MHITDAQVRAICYHLMSRGYTGNKDSIALLEQNVDKGTAIAIIGNFKSNEEQRIEDALKQLEHLGIPLTKNRYDV